MNVKVNGTYVFLNPSLMTIDVFLYEWQNGNNRPAEITSKFSFDISKM